MFVCWQYGSDQVVPAAPPGGRETAEPREEMGRLHVEQVTKDFNIKR